MAIDTHKVLILKAHFLGHAIAEREVYRTEALRMIDRAIGALEAGTDEQGRLRLLFYVLLKAEILRECEETIELRQRAQQIAATMGSEVYADYMRVEDATRTRKRAYGSGEACIADRGIRSTTPYAVNKRDGRRATVRREPALQALGLDEWALSHKEYRFLYGTSLMQLLEHHGVY